MQLSFTTHINNQPSYFIPKIWLSLWKEAGFKSDVLKILNEFHDKFGISALQIPKEKMNELKPKKHTIREDKSNRWKVGNKIHFVTNPYTKQRFQFAPIVEVISIQHIRIEWRSYSCYPHIEIWNSDDTKRILDPIEHFDYITQLEDLAINDGFEDFEQFLDYFDMDFEGKIIHWTNEKY